MGELPAAVEEVRDELTVAFYEFAAERVGELEAAGDEEASDALDELCGRVMAASERTFGSLVPSLGDGGSGAVDDGEEEGASGSHLTLAEERLVQERWDAISAQLALEGEGAALAQARKNATSRRESVTAILGRAPMGPKEMRSLNLGGPGASRTFRLTHRSL